MLLDFVHNQVMRRQFDSFRSYSSHLLGGAVGVDHLELTVPSAKARSPCVFTQRTVNGEILQPGWRK